MYGQYSNISHTRPINQGLQNILHRTSAPPIFKKVPKPFYGWVWKQIDIYSVWDSSLSDSIKIGKLPYNSKVEALEYHPTADWIYATLYSPDYSKDTKKELMRFYIPAQKGVNWLAKSDHPNAVKCLTTDSNSSLFYIKEGETLDNLVKKKYLPLLTTDNIFMVGDDFKMRLRRLITHIYRQNKFAFNDKGQLLSEKTLFIYSDEYLRNHSEKFLHITDPIPYTDSVLEGVIDSVVLYKDFVPQIVINSTIAGFVAGIINGLAQSIVGLINGVISTYDDFAEFIKILGDLTFKKIVVLIHDLLTKEGWERVYEEIVRQLTAVKDHFLLLYHDLIVSLSHPKWEQRGFAVGTLIGYVICEIIQWALTGVIGKAVLIVLRVLSKFSDILAKIVIILRTALAGSEFSETKYEAIKKAMEEKLQELQKAAQKGWETVEGIFEVEDFMSISPTLMAKGKTKVAKRKKTGDTSVNIKRTKKNSAVHNKSGKLDEFDSLIETATRRYQARSVGRNFAFVISDLTKNKFAGQIISVKFELTEMFEGVTRGPVDKSATKKYQHQYGPKKNPANQGLHAGHTLAVMFVPGIRVGSLTFQTPFQNQHWGTPGTFAWFEVTIKEKLQQKFKKKNNKGRNDRSSKVAGEITPILDSNTQKVTGLKYELWDVNANKSYKKIGVFEFSTLTDDLMDAASK